MRNRLIGAYSPQSPAQYRRNAPPATPSLSAFATPGIALIGKTPRQVAKYIECLFDFARYDRVAVGKGGDLTGGKRAGSSFDGVQFADMALR